MTIVDIIDKNEIKNELLSNGVVVEFKDDTYSGVLHADDEIALYMSHGFSVTIDVSHIVNADVAKAVKRFCHTADENSGELSIIISVNHPRLQNVLRLREVHNRLTIKVNDAFMHALLTNTRYGDEQNNILPDALWNQIAHCNIMFNDKNVTAYCGYEVSHINLLDFVVYSRENTSFNHEAFIAKCDELLKQSKDRVELYKQKLNTMVDETNTASNLEYNLVKTLRDNTLKSCNCFVYTSGSDVMLQKMELEPESSEANELLSQIDSHSNYRIEIVPTSYNGRTNEHKAACIKAWQNRCDELRIACDRMPSQHYMANEEHILKRPVVLEADVVRFQNKKEKWIAFIGLIDGRPYEIFTGIADDDEGIFCPKSVNYGKIIKAVDEHGLKRYDFQFINKRGFKTTIEGLSEKFNPEFWNYAKLISGVLRYGMPIEQVVKLVSSLELDNLSINNWKSGVIKALKKYLPNPDSEA